MFLFLVHCYADSPRSSFLIYIVVFEGRNCALDNLLSETCLFSFISVPSTDRQASYNSSMVATAIINQTTRAHPFYHDDDGDYHYCYYHCIIIIIIIIIIN